MFKKKTKIFEGSKVLVKKQDDITGNCLFFRVSIFNSKYLKKLYSEETGNVCVDLMDSEFCESAYLNDYCNELFYWNGKNIGSEWCKKMCKKC